MAYNYKTIGINANALKAFRNWYTRRKPSADAYRASFESREDAHILRVAAFLCINDDSWILQSSHLRLALRIVAEVKHNAHRLFSNMADGRSKIILGIEQARIMLLSSEQEPVPRSKLWLRCRRHLRYEEFTAMLETMHDAGAIQRFTIREDNGGRPADLIRATKSLADRSIVSTLADRMY